MTWDRSRAIARINKHLTTVPTVDLKADLAQHGRWMMTEKAAAAARGTFPRGHAVLVEGAHLYGQLLDFEDVVAQNRVETEQTHARILEFLHVYYGLWDSIVEEDDAIRVDYHGPRLHAVITGPKGKPAEQVLRAIALAKKLGDAVARVGASYGFPARVRFGIDQGRCLAMSTGRDLEQDILFLGSPANHAAKVAAAEPREGIYLAENARKILSVSAQVRDIRNESIAKSAAAQYAFSRVDAAVNEAQERSKKTRVQFKFRRVAPPLSTLKFEELTPANSVRMGMMSLFGDIDGFTKYVDGAISNGAEGVQIAVRDIHVLREELNSVLRADFGGKRVRFIGDCIHGLITEGTQQRDDATKSVREAYLCATGMASSFKEARSILGTIDGLGLAVGGEYGPIPVTRLGLRGEDSVRCAAGLAVIQSERVQQSIRGSGIRFGSAALAAADRAVKELAASSQLVEYSDAADHLAVAASPVVTVIRNDPTARPHFNGG